MADEHNDAQSAGNPADPKPASAGCGCGCASTGETSSPQDIGAPTVGQPDEDAHGDTESASGCCGSGSTVSDTDESSDETDAEASQDGCCQEELTLEQQLENAVESQKRIAAEYANFRRRTERDRASIGAFAKSAVVLDFLPVIDDLELAKQHGDLQGPLKAISEKLRAAFTKHNVTEFGAVGDEFNPEFHEAVQDTSQGDTKVIGTVLRPGFMIGDRLVRTAMVIISDPEGDDASASS